MKRRYTVFSLAVIIMFVCAAGCGVPGEKDFQPAVEQDNQEQNNPEQNNPEQNNSEQSSLEQRTEEAMDAMEESAAEKAAEEKEPEVMKIKVSSEEYEIVYELNRSRAAKELYAQLPLTLEVKDFSTNEKTFYPPEALDVSDAPPANAGKGTLAYYSPWEDVVMFYDHFGEGSSLYELGEAVSGTEDIEKLAGTITVAVFEK